MIAQDTGHLNPDDVVALRQSRLEYAEAVTLYHNAVMAWLAHADKTKDNTPQFIRKTGE